MSTAPSASQAPSSTKDTASKPPVTFPTTTYLDPSAYVRGVYPITIGENTIIYPRAHLLSIHAPLHISEGCLISTKAIIGGPLPPTDTTTTSPRANGPPTDVDDSTSPQASSTTSPTDPTVLGSNVHIHPSSLISHSVTIGSSTIIEAHVTIDPGINVGSHVKICAGVKVSRDVPDWTVVYGDGNQRRVRRNGEEGEEIERVRLRALGKEREAVRDVLRRTAVEKTGAGGGRKR